MGTDVYMNYNQSNQIENDGEEVNEKHITLDEA